MRTQYVRRAVVVVTVILLAGCGASAGKQSVDATTPTSMKVNATTTSRPRTTTPTTRVPPPPHWAPASFAANPTDVAVGQQITYSGAGCPAGARVQVFAPGSVLNTRVRPDGTWSETGVVPDDSTQVGSGVPAYANCDLKIAFVYTPIRLNITTYRHLEVQPGTIVHPGETLTVTAVGSCTEDDFLVGLRVRPNDPPGKDTFLTASGGVFSGPFVVPASTPPGSYLLNGTCMSFRTYGPGFMQLPITVVAEDVTIPPSSGSGTRIPVTR